MADTKYALILHYIKDIPLQLRYIFVPKDEKSLEELEEALVQKAAKRADKIKAQNLRLEYKKDLPLKSRRWSLRYIRIRIAIIELKKQIKDRWKDEGSN